MVAKFILCVLAALCTLQGSEAAQFRTAYIDIQQVIRELIDHIKHIIEEILKKLEGLGKHGEAYWPWDKLVDCVKEVRPDVAKIADDVSKGVVKCSQDSEPNMKKIAEKVQEVVQDGKNTVEQVIADMQKLCVPCAIEHGKEYLDRVHKAEEEIIDLAKNISADEKECLSALLSTIKSEAVAVKDKFVACIKA